VSSSKQALRKPQILNKPNYKFGKEKDFDSIIPKKAPQQQQSSTVHKPRTNTAKVPLRTHTPPTSHISDSVPRRTLFPMGDRSPRTLRTAYFPERSSRNQPL